MQDSNKRAKQALNAANLRVKELEQSVQHLTSKLRHLEEQLRDQRCVLFPRGCRITTSHFNGRETLLSLVPHVVTEIHV